VYPLAVGFFVTCIFVFLASVYLNGETNDPELKRRFKRHAAVANGLVIASGGLVFAASFLERESLPAVFFRTPATLVVMALATLLFAVLWLLIRKRNPLLTRVVAGGQVTLILLGWWLLYAPDAVLTAHGALNFYAEAAPEATLRQLVIALLVGSAFIFPSLFFLLKVFKSK
jgi:cytochrome d ubiquinol oxidase subunit II